MSPTPLRNKARKRAVSMAGAFGRDKPKPVLSPKSKRRSLGPPKGILKSRINNVEDSIAPSLSTDMTAYNMQRALEPVNFESDTIRRNLTTASRRVSFAATASVRTIRDLREGNTNSTESPSSPLASDDDGNEDSANSSRDTNSQLASGVASNDAELSMEIEEASTGSYDGDSMDATSMFGDGIVDRRRSSISAFRPSARSSLAPRNTSRGSGKSPRDSSHPVGEPLRPPKPPSQALLDLQSVVSSSFHRTTHDHESEMELDEAVHRLSAVWNSASHQNVGNDTFSSISNDSMQQQDQTMDFTKIGFSSLSRIEDSGIQASVTGPIAQEIDMSISDPVGQSDSQSRILDASLSPPELFEDIPYKAGNLADNDKSFPYSAQEPNNPLQSLEQEDHGNPDLLLTPADTIPQKTTEKQNEGISDPPIKTPFLSEPIRREPSYRNPTRATATKTNIPLLRKAGSTATEVASNSQMRPRSSLPNIAPATSVRRPSGYLRARQSMNVPCTGSEIEIQASTPPVIGEEDIKLIEPTIVSSLGILSPIEHTSSPSRARRVRRSSNIENSVADLSQVPTEPPSALIGLEEFHIMTGVKFMDEIACPRKSAIRLSLNNARRDSLQVTQKICGRADYYIAMNATVPQLHIYSWVANEMRKWIDESKETYLKAEEEVARVTPALFLEFAEADDEARQDYTGFLKLVKACEQLRAKSIWYQWKRGWVSQVNERSLKAKASLEEDSRILRFSRERLSSLLPFLRERNIAVLQALADEKRVVEEIGSGNLQQLDELKETISEQRGILEEYYTRVSEARSTLDSLKDRLSEMSSQQAIVRKDIEGFQGRITLQTGSTCSGVLRIKDDLEWIQKLHKFKVQTVDQRMLRFAFGSQFDVAINCGEGMDQVQSVEILVRPQRQHMHDCLASFSEYMVRVGYQETLRLRHAQLQANVQHLMQVWASMGQVYSQLAFLAAQWPLSLNLASIQGMTAEIQLLFRTVKAKVSVSFHFDHDVLVQWPMTLRRMRFEVCPVYGDIDCAVLSNAIHQRLSEASSADSHACLQDACCAALAKYQ